MEKSPHSGDPLNYSPNFASNLQATRIVVGSMYLSIMVSMGRG